LKYWNKKNKKMESNYLKRVILLLVTCFFTFFGSAQSDDNIKILGGVKNGTYEKMAYNMKNILELPIEVIESEGSVFNLNRLSKSKFIDAGFIQYDVLLYAQLQDFEKNTKQTATIQLLLPLGIEDIHIIVKKDSKIASLKDLKNKNVAVGTKNAGTNQTAQFIKEKTGIKWTDVEKDLKQGYLLLLNDKIDAIMFVGSAPVESIVNPLPQLKNIIKFIPVQHEELDKIYPKSKITKSQYEWSDADVETYGVKFVLATDNKYEDDAKKARIEMLVNALKAGMSKLQSEGHEAWKQVDFDFSSFDWEVHEAAQKAFQ
jgi:uncharacterized protein